MKHTPSLNGLLLLVALCGAAGASQAVAQPRALHPASRVDPTPPALPPAGLRNVLLIIVDDMGIDLSKQYLPVTGNPPATLPAMPVIRRLAQSGIIFHNAWANPVCSPTRAGILTGRHAFRTTVTNALPNNLNDPGLPAGELTLPELIADTDADADAEYVSGLFGKWHLGGGVTGPNDQGFAEHRGSLIGELDYHAWDKYVNGVKAINPVTDYPTQVTAADAADWIEAQTNLENRWFAMVAFNAPHGPLHTPTDACDGVDSDDDNINAMIECVNDHIHALLTRLESIGALENTTVIFVGDNGTDSASIQGPFAPPPGAPSNLSYKGEVYEGGIRVPLIIADGYHLQHGTVAPASSGRGYISNPGRREETMVHTVDIFATVAGIVGVASTAEDSVSILPHLGADARLLPPQHYARQYMYTERCASGVMYQAAIRNSEHKLIYRLDYNTGVLEQELYAVTDLAEMTPLSGMAPVIEAHLLLQLNILWASERFNPSDGCHWVLYP